MSGTSATDGLMRVERAEANRLAWAFAISLGVHLVLWGAWYAGQKFAWWDHWKLPKWMEPSTLLAKVLPKPPEAVLQPPLQEPPLMFVNVAEAQAAAEAPEKAPFYSSRNSQAANPAPKVEAQVPQIDGTQTEVLKTEDVPPRFVPLQPSRPAPAPAAVEPQEEAKAQPKPEPGYLSVAKAPPVEKPNTGTEQKTRPRTLKEARARQEGLRPPTEKMRQEGGVRRQLDISSVDALATPFGAYDQALVDAVELRWYSLLQERSYASDDRGKVVLNFVLHQDGRISEMRVAENTVGEVLGLICQKAVLDPAPFAPWPTEMRRMMGSSRNIQFTFYYR